MTLATAANSRTAPSTLAAGILIACPDSRPPAYQAVVGFDRDGLLGSFLTGFYHDGRGLTGAIGRRSARLARALSRRHHPEIPGDRVRSAWSFDLALSLENRSRRLRSPVARWRTRRFDRVLAARVRRDRPDLLFAFSDVASEFALPVCRDLGVPTIVSVVHGEPSEEREILEREAATSPEFYPIYLGGERLDHDDLAWLHERRRRDAELADRLLVPSQHIADRYRRGGIPAEKIQVIPYAADTSRFRPDPRKIPGDGCTFLFAGGISQRKGIGYLLRAWQMVRRPGWRLRLLGAPPADVEPLRPYQDGVEWLGRLPHGEVPGVMASADAFVFPSLFEGSAVVTYEAMACGLPSIVTPNAGSVVRDGLDGRLVAAADVESLALAMTELGEDRDKRLSWGASARLRAEAFDWARYQDALRAAVVSIGRGRGTSRGR